MEDVRFSDTGIPNQDNLQKLGSITISCYNYSVKYLEEIVIVAAFSHNSLDMDLRIGRRLLNKGGEECNTGGDVEVTRLDVAVVMAGLQFSTRKIQSFDNRPRGFNEPNKRQSGLSFHFRRLFFWLSDVLISCVQVC